MLGGVGVVEWVLVGVVAMAGVLGLVVVGMGDPGGRPPVGQGWV